MQERCGCQGRTAEELSGTLCVQKGQRRRDSGEQKEASAAEG